MIDFMGISPADMLDASKVKVIDGIAGAGKSSGLHIWLTGAGVKYGRYTSTNALKRDAAKRYDMSGCCDTIAGGLFTNEQGKFYVEQKPSDFTTVVIDEILQADKRALDWVDAYRGFCNIFITTDSRQMLAPGCAGLQSIFEDFCHRDYVIYTTTNKTLRAVDSYTASAYEDLYENAADGYGSFDRYRGRIPVIDFDSMPINADSVYITHTKAIEDYMYRYCGVKKVGFTLIPKGNIARKPPADLTRYPCLSQMQAESRRYSSYTQCSGIATPTRYQGQEVDPGKTCYYIIEPTSMVTNREFYTVVTRCKSFSSLVLVVIRIPEAFKLEKFCGKPINEIRYAKTTSEMLKEKAVEKYGADYNVDNDLTTINGRLAGTKRLLWLVRACDPAPDGMYNSGDIVYIDGSAVWLDGIAEVLPDVSSKKPTPRGMLEKEDDMDYTYMFEVYKALDERGISRIVYPYPNRTEHRADIYKNNHYCVDMFCAYLQILSHTRVPVDGRLEYDPDYDRGSRIGFYVCRGEKALAHECIITDELLEFCDPTSVDFLFSAPCKHGVRTAAKWLDDAKKSLECKAKYKAMPWGYLQKPYLQDESDFFVMDPRHCREILMIAIISAMVSTMFRASGGFERYIVIDAVHVKTEGEARIVMSRLINMGYDCRLSHIYYEDNEVGDKIEEILDQSYLILSAAEKRRERDRERKRRQRAAARA